MELQLEMGEAVRFLLDLKMNTAFGEGHNDNELHPKQAQKSFTMD